MGLLYIIFSLADSLGRSHMLSDPYFDLGKELAVRSPKAHKSLIVTSVCLSWGHVETRLIWQPDGYGTVLE